MTAGRKRAKPVILNKGLRDDKKRIAAPPSTLSQEPSPPLRRSTHNGENEHDKKNELTSDKAKTKQ
ncbi:hypothetical protein AA0112_g6745 [Alternaria arborescens]|nr:hypothetical protein AA0112_g6745 [Alternaria arborescens]